MESLALLGGDEGRRTDTMPSPVLWRRAASGPLNCNSTMVEAEAASRDQARAASGPLSCNSTMVEAETVDLPVVVGHSGWQNVLRS